MTTLNDEILELTADQDGVLRDKFDQKIYTTDQIADSLMLNPSVKISDFQVLESREYQNSNNALMAGFELPSIYNPDILEKSQWEFDTELQNSWLVPAEYQDLDILTWLLERAPDLEAQERVCMEYKLYEKYQLVDFLRFLKYLTDVLKQNSVIQGLGRGSSVSSYCLYLLGVHRIDPIKYNLDISEFLR
jgi:DNA polymerase III alpha subunit